VNIGGQNGFLRRARASGRPAAAKNAFEAEGMGAIFKSLLNDGETLHMLFRVGYPKKCR